jgi:hypothetical protein
VSDEICKCGHRESQHEANVCSWWKCHCRQFEPLTAEEPKRQLKPFEELSYAVDSVSVDVASQEVEEQRPLEEFPYAGGITSDDVTAHEVEEERRPLEESPYAGDIISPDVAAQEVDELRSKLRAAQEEIERLKQLQDGNYVLATRLGAENNLLRESLAEIKRLIEAILARP